MSAVTISALGSRVLVQDDDALWEPGSGQLQIAFPEPTADAPQAEPPPASVAPSAARLTIHRHVPGSPGDAVRGEDASTTSADEWYDTALDLEATDVGAALVQLSDTGRRHA